jgi:PAS domain S-box-containing protein
MPLSLAFSADRILDSLSDGVYVTDPERRILFWNQGAERITGYQPKDLLGKTCYDDILVHTDLRGNPLCGREYCPLHRSIVSGQSARVPLILFARTREGKRIPVQVSVSPIRNEEGQIVGGVEVFRDLSQLIQDLERASGIQKQAMDISLPEDSRVAFALHISPLEYVCGDFLRVERLDENRYGIMAADVTGHGVAAALYTMQLRSLWEALKDDLTHPEVFTSRMNDELAILVRDNFYFATAICGVLDLKQGAFEYAGAGHPQPFVFHADGSVEALSTRGMALGMLAGEDYPRHTLRLREGDTILIYSDGAVEQIDPEGKRLEEEGFLELLRKEGFPARMNSLAKIEEALLQTAGTLFLGDDLSLLRIDVKTLG